MKNNFRVLLVSTIISIACYSSVTAAKQEIVKIAGSPLTVTIITDANGVPHIRGATDFSAYAGLGYAMARDRLWQMDIFRRTAAGRLAEVAGPGPDNSVLSQDILFRIQDFSSVAQEEARRASFRTQSLLHAFSAGVNTYIDEARDAGNLPLEFQLLGYEPEPWTPTDTFLVGKALFFQFEISNWGHKINRTIIAATLGNEVASALVPTAPNSPSLVDATGSPNPLSDFLHSGTSLPNVSAEVLPLPDPSASTSIQIPLLNFKSLYSWAGSNSIAIDGRLTTTGKPLLENDPHLGLSVPSIFYFYHVKTWSTDAQGLGVPGLPILLSGYNRNIAWGVTASLTDLTDTYLEQIRPSATGEEVLFKGEWVPVETRMETIAVAGRDAATVQVKVTPHGPLLNAVMPGLDAIGPIALKTALVENRFTMDGGFVLHEARNFTLFKHALRRFGGPANWVFADSRGRYGHVGYVQSGLIPIRPSANGFFLVPGHDGSHEWTGFAGKELVNFYNPPSHAVFTANNRIVPDEYAPFGETVYLGNAWAPPWRAQRIATKLLESSELLSRDDLADYALDTQFALGQELAALLVEYIDLAGLPVGDPDAAASREVLANWDGNTDADSRGAAIYSTLVAVLMRDMSLPLLGPEGYAGYAQAVLPPFQHSALVSLLRDPKAPFFNASSPNDAQIRTAEVVSRALGEADSLLRQTLGDNAQTWRWGDLHTLTYNHPFAALVPQFNIGSFEAQGGFSTLNVGGFFTNIGLLALPPAEFEARGGLRAVFAQDLIAGARSVWDLSGADNSIGVLSTGQSGDPNSVHFSDHALLWREGAYLALPFSDQAVGVAK